MPVGASAAGTPHPRVTLAEVDHGPCPLMPRSAHAVDAGKRPGSAAIRAVVPMTGRLRMG